MDLIHSGSRGLGTDTDNSKICNEPLHVISNLYYFAEGEGGLISLSRASFKVGLTGNMAEGTLGLSSHC